MSESREFAETRKELELVRTQLRRSQALASLGELTATATHEFNNILTTILNYAKLGLRTRDESARDKALGKILEATQRATKISNTILAQARNRCGEITPAALAEIIDDALILLEREMRKYRILVQREYHPCRLALVNGNDIHRVLINLLVNSRQAMPDGGTIFIKLVEDTDTNHAILSVRDTGLGIPAEILPRIFDPYFSSKSGPDATGKGGTGLGLAVCREIIEAHHGRVRVESTVGRGTQFTIWLPLVPQRVAAITS